MTDLQAQATAFAAMIMKDDRRETFSREDMYYAYRDAYEQGWVDCDTKGDKPETQDEYFNDGFATVPLHLFATKYGLDVEEAYARVKDKVIDKEGHVAESVPHISLGFDGSEISFHIDDINCKWYDLGNCAKGLPGTPCERKGCMAYYPKETSKTSKTSKNE